MTMKLIWKKRVLLVWGQWIKPALVVIVLLCTFRSAIADWNDVPTGSMRPTILEGDRIFVNKLAYDLKVPFTTRRVVTWSEPGRGDVVVLYSPATGTRLVKRVIGVPGDRIELRRNQLLINGVAAAYKAFEPLSAAERDEAHSLDELRRATPALPLFFLETMDGKIHPVQLTPGVASPRTFAPMTVPEDHYFVMGDNRDQSGDSRSFGFVPRNLIVGRATHVVFSVDREDYYLPRWDRFLRRLP
jgi:signal peptidase I